MRQPNGQLLMLESPTAALKAIEKRFNNSPNLKIIKWTPTKK